MDGLVEITNSRVLKMGYFYDFDRMDEAALRDEFIALVDDWDSYGGDEEAEREDSFPTSEDLYKVGTQIKEAIGDRTDKDFILRYNYISSLYKIERNRIERSLYEQRTEKKAY